MSLKQISPSLKEDIHIWNIKVSFDHNIIFRFESILSADEKKKANRFKFEKDKLIYITARGILRLLSGKYLKISPKEIKFDYSEYGKPFFKTDTSLKFNVSHSGERIAIAFSQGQEIGIDIEKIKDDFNVIELARNFFSKNEIKALEQVSKSEVNRAFYRCWTRKESFIKAEGSGLSFPLDKFAVSLDKDEQAELLKTDWEATEKDMWSLYSFVPCEEYIGAIAYRSKVVSLKYYEWDSNIIESI